ncbi:MAG: DNA recombination protein RmuC [Zoogloeaceae bacterium]|nr:DNA recombination protein RmuC [Zoogloeaceae bacterium]
MNEMLIYLLLGLVFVVLVMQILQLLRNRRELSAEALGLRFQVLESGLERLERELRSEIARSRTESVEAARGDRAEQSQSLERLGKGLATQVGQLGTLQTQQFDAFGQHLARLTQSFDGRAEQLRQSVETRLSAIQTDNAAKLEEMRKTVDEKLHATLEQRLGESFKLVSDRLEQVHRGLGEMQTLASGVGDLKKMLTNVKTRGTWGEVQLAALLDQVLTAEQYAANVATRPRSNERVEFAIKLPGREEGEPVWLPIDAKFPVEDYQRLVEAQESADAVAAEAAAKALEIRLKDEGRKIREKYIEPPFTTDFAILYLPTEGLYAEALRRPGLAEWLQREQRVSIAGPTTLAAMLNSLQMGFRTLAIERRSSEVWVVLGAVKTEFTKFGEALSHTRKKLQEASNSIDKAEVRTRAVTRRLKEVEALPAPEAAALIGEDPASLLDDESEA